MSRTKRILINISSNWLGFAVNAVLTLLLTPFVLSNLGPERYGVWVLTVSLVGSYGLLDLGLRSGVNQFLIRTVAGGNASEINKIVSTALAALAVLGILVTTVALISAVLLPDLFDIPMSARREARLCLIVVGISAGVQIALAPFASVFVALQRFDLSNLISVSMRILAAVLTVAALKSGYGLVGVAFATAAPTAIEYVIKAVVSHRLLPEMTPSTKFISQSSLKSIAGFGGWSFLIAVSEYGYAHLLPILVAVLMPVAAVGHYALAAGLWQQLNMLFAPLGQVIYPAATEMHVRNERGSLIALYKDGTRFLLLIVVAVISIAFVWADDFYRLWIGEQYLTNDHFTSVSTIFRIMLLSTLFGYSVNFAGQILLGAGYVKRLAILKSSGIGSVLLLSAFLIPQIGLIGIPVSMAVSLLIFDVFGVPHALRKAENLWVNVFGRFGGLRVVVVAVVTISTFITIRGVWEPKNWSTLILHGVIAAGVVATVIVAAGLTSEERMRFVFRPLQKAFPGSN